MGDHQTHAGEGLEIDALAPQAGARPVAETESVPTLSATLRVQDQNGAVAGGIAGQNLVLNVYAYQKAFASSQYGLGAAIGVIMLLVLVIPTVLYIRTLRRSGNEL